MEIILLENIINLGNIGDKVRVKDGYGRNYLLKKGKALRFNKENKELIDKKKNELDKKNKEIKNKFIEKAKLINNKTFNFVKESKPSQIILKNELNKIGLFKVEINFHSEVKATVSIKIDKVQSK